MTFGPFEDRPPQSGELTDYDWSHLSAYLRLLDAADEGADWQEAVRIIFGLDATDQPERAPHLRQPSRASPLDDSGRLSRSPEAACELTP
jgi:hypothetical protein